MKSRSRFSRRSLLTIGLVGWGVVGANSARAEEPLVVQAPNYPLYYFADRIASESFDVRYRVPDDLDPAFWEPSDEDLLAFQQADIILRNGATYSKWMKHVSLPSSRIVDTTREIRERFIATEGEEHSHGDGHAHTHGGTAFVTWLDFEQATVQAEAIARRFRAMRPSEAGEIEENLEGLLEQLESLHVKAKKVGEEIGDRPLLASHPVYQYFARAYGLNLESLEWEPSMKIEARQVEELEKLLESHGAKWMIWEGKPATRNVERLETLGLQSVVFSPSANRPGAGDWLEVMESNLERLGSIVP